MKKEVRRTQLISPWGVGAIIPFDDDESVMVCGLEAWRYSDKKEDKDEYVIEDERLKQRLNVKELRIPLDYRPRYSEKGNKEFRVPVIRFPSWHYCPKCGSMEIIGITSETRYCSACSKGRRKTRLVPEQYIVICNEGHIDDFPFEKFVHSEKPHKLNSLTCKLKRRSGGSSSSSASLEYICSCGERRTMFGVTRSNSLKGIYECSGNKPWLGIYDTSNAKCDSEVHVVQKGATNVWFPDIVSSIFVPQQHDEAYDLALRKLIEFTNSSTSDSSYVSILAENIANKYGIDHTLLLKLYKELPQPESELQRNITEQEFRYHEYEKLKTTSTVHRSDFYCVNKKIISYHPTLVGLISSVSQVHNLKETRALVGFSRYLPSGEKSISEKKKMLSKGNVNWLPAVVVYGEGIFIEFDEEAIKKWSENKSVINRIKHLRENFLDRAKWNNFDPNIIDPRFVLLHTFSHILINQLCFQSGYNSSSLRERIYCNTTDEISMNGVLIYTSSPDSEGSLGGLVRQGKPGNIEQIILNGVINASWCSTDPVCIESVGQGPNSCNLAACHDCALVSETSCENGNKFLDRGLIVGTLTDTNIGFFSSLIEKGPLIL